MAKEYTTTKNSRKNEVLTDLRSAEIHKRYLKSETRIYKVIVYTNGVGYDMNRSRTYHGKSVSHDKIEYFACEEGVVYVLTEDPRLIYDVFTPDTVISITDIGVGYSL